MSRPYSMDLRERVVSAVEKEGPSLSCLGMQIGAFGPLRTTCLRARTNRSAFVLTKRVAGSSSCRRPYAARASAPVGDRDEERSYPPLAGDRTRNSVGDRAKPATAEAAAPFLRGFQGKKKGRLTSNVHS
jgi:hypothetical protein